jgi:hypothetical protein
MNDEFDELQGPDEADADLLDDDGETPTEACPLCGAEVYAHADRCPECGQFIIPGSDPETPRGKLLAKVFRAIIVVVLGLLAAALILSARCR